MTPPDPVEPAELEKAPKGRRETGLPFLLRVFPQTGVGFCDPNPRLFGLLQEPDMLQDIPTPTLREASPCVLETERLLLRKPTLADVKAIARLANDRRIADNTRRLPHPYSDRDAIEFVRAIAAGARESVFLIESDSGPIGMVANGSASAARIPAGHHLRNREATKRPLDRSSRRD